MAIPFYNQGDQDIYAGGDHFIPQSQYRLNYTPSQVLAGTVGNTGGITATQAGQSYRGYPSYEAWLAAQRASGPDGGGGDDEDDSGYSNLGLSPGAYGGKLPGFGNWANRTFGDLGYAFSKVPTFSKALGWAGDRFKGWQKKRAAQKEEDLMNEIKEHNLKAAMDAQIAGYTGPETKDFNPSITGTRDFHPSQGNRSDTRDQGGGYSTQGGFQASSPGEDVRGHHGAAQGGRIGYNRGRVVNPGGYQGDEFEDDLTTMEFMQDQGIPHGEMVEGPSPFEMRIQELMDEGMSWQEAYKIASKEFGQVVEGEGDSFSEEGIASIV